MESVDITKIVIALIGVLSTVITTFVIPWINTKLKNEKVRTAIEIAAQVVSAAQELQITGDLEKLGLTKAEYAWNEAKKALAKKGITISDEELTAYIKAAVTELRTRVEW